MKKLTLIIATLSLIALNGCVTTETRYSSHMYGNNPNTATTGKTTDGKPISNTSGASILDSTAPEQCSNCSRNVPIIRPAN